MEKNSEAYYFENCPVVSLKVTEWEYPYEPFDIKNCNDTLNKQGFSQVTAYVAELIRDAMCKQKNLNSVLEELVSIYTEQRNQKSLLHIFIGEWICDLSLAVGIPHEIFRLCSCEAFEISLVRDFAAGDYICSFLKGEPCCEAKLLSALRVLSEYDFTKSLYYQNNREIYQKAVSAALSAALKRALSEYGRGFFVPERRRICHTAFSGLPCDRECSKRLETEYIPFCENTELRIFITALVKCTDNFIRQGLGIKSKLVGFTLSAEYRRLISDTIRKEIPGFLPAPSKVGRKPKEKSEKTFTRKSREIQKEQYEPINLSIDFSRAKRLEAESWKLTSLLGADYGGNDISVDVDEIYGKKDKEEKNFRESRMSENVEITVQDTETPEYTENIPEEWREFFSLLTKEEKTVLTLVARGMDTQETIKKYGGMLKGFADSINEKAYDAYGDIIIEDVGRRLEFIEDYRDELTHIFML